MKPKGIEIEFGVIQSPDGRIWEYYDCEMGSGYYIPVAQSRADYERLKDERSDN